MEVIGSYNRVIELYNAGYRVTPLQQSYSAECIRALPKPPPSRFPSTLEISLGLRIREISRVSGNLLGIGDGFPNTSRIFVEYGHSPNNQSIYRDGSGK